MVSPIYSKLTLVTTMFRTDTPPIVVNQMANMILDDASNEDIAEFLCALIEHQEKTPDRSLSAGAGILAARIIHGLRDSNRDDVMSMYYEKLGPITCPFKKFSKK